MAWLVAFASVGVLLILLFLRERRHIPLSFQKYFPNFKPTLSTHRGYGKHGPIAENTVSAFLASEKLGFRAHELDVRRTRDREIALLHGPRLEMTTNGSGRMENSTLEEIRRLNAAHYLGAEAPQKPVPLPTLAEVLNTVSKKSTINIEIKRDRWDLTPGVEDFTVRVVTLENAERRVCFSGFHFLTLFNLRRYRTKIPIGLLIEPGVFARFKLLLYRFLLLPDNIHLHYSTATPRLVAHLKKRGYGVAFWTVDDFEIAQKLFALGADVVITNRMDMLKKLQ
ncbi:MAG: hypothetical protein JSR44_10185 [Spirochaetes bacterium]|nr:hypothetical protein [Spirochaetota bacterium]